MPSVVVYREAGSPRDLLDLEEARRLIQRAATIDEVSMIRDQAEAIRLYVRKRDASLDVINAAAEIKILAERRMGEMLAAMPKHQGGRPTENPSHNARGLSSMGINYSLSSRCQSLARIPQDDFDSHIQKAKDSGREMTTSGVLKLAKRLDAAKRCEPDDAAISKGTRAANTLQELIDGGSKFGTIYADPPWRYRNWAAKSAADNHYVTMTVAEICAEPVREIVADDAHLHLWTTNAFLREAFDVIDAWGFVYKSCFVWVKPHMGAGNYWRLSHEFLLLGIRGECPFGAKDEISWGEFDRGHHSAKPDEVRRKIERVSPGPYLEMYGRELLEDSPWTVYGNQLQERPTNPRKGPSS